MSLNVRLLIIVAVGAIVALSCFAVYSMLGGDNAAEHKELGSLDNYNAATALKPLPEIHFLDGAGKDRTLADFKGKVVVLNLWATWCTPCVAEMPTLERLQQKMGENDVAVIALSIDRGGVETVREFFDRIGVKGLPIFVDPTMRAQSVLSAFGLPTTIIIDREGKERGRLLGPAEWDSSRAIELVEAAMAPAK